MEGRDTNKQELRDGTGTNQAHLPFLCVAQLSNYAVFIELLVHVYRH